VEDSADALQRIQIETTTQPRDPIAFNYVDFDRILFIN